jgi:hypothetical protein
MDPTGSFKATEPDQREIAVDPQRPDDPPDSKPESCL